MNSNRVTFVQINLASSSKYVIVLILFELIDLTTKHPDVSGP